LKMPCSSSPESRKRRWQGNHGARVARGTDVLRRSGRLCVQLKSSSTRMEWELS
jgi:hypothetical protein